MEEYVPYNRVSIYIYIYGKWYVSDVRSWSFRQALQFEKLKNQVLPLIALIWHSLGPSLKRKVEGIWAEIGSVGFRKTENENGVTISYRSLSIPSPSPSRSHKRQGDYTPWEQSPSTVTTESERIAESLKAHRYLVLAARVSRRRRRDLFSSFVWALTTATCASFSISRRFSPRKKTLLYTCASHRDIARSRERRLVSLQRENNKHHRDLQQEVNSGDDRHSDDIPFLLIPPKF